MNSSWDEKPYIVNNDNSVFARQPHTSNGIDYGTIGQAKPRSNSNATSNTPNTSYGSLYTSQNPRGSYNPLGGRRPQTSTSLDPNGFMGHDIGRDPTTMFNSAPNLQYRPEDLPPQYLPAAHAQSFSLRESSNPHLQSFSQNVSPRGGGGYPQMRSNESSRPLGHSYGSSSNAASSLPNRSYASEIDHISNAFNMTFSIRNEFPSGNPSYFDNPIREEAPIDFFSLPDNSMMSFYSRNTASPSQLAPSPLASPSTYQPPIMPVQNSEIPSRNLLIRKIDSEFEDNALWSLFQAFGELKTFELYKQRGFLMLSYFDIRSANQALKKLNGHRGIEVCYAQPAVPKSINPPQNHGTLVVFNVDIGLKDEEILRFFLPYGEIKEIRVSPKKADQKFIEYYDTRCAESALNALKGTQLGRYRINIEYSRPGGKQRIKDDDADFSRRSTSCPDRTIFSPPKQSILSPRANPISPPLSSPLSSFSFAPTTISQQPPRIPSPFGMGSINSAIDNPEPRPSSSSLTGMSRPVESPKRSMDNDFMSMAGIPFGEGGNRQDDTNFYVCLENISGGKDKRTTIMIKNIPNKYGNSSVLQLINKKFKEKYDFFYLPIDFQAKSNFGFAFINFVNYVDIIDFYQEFNGFQWPQYSSSKIVEIRYARLQGKLDLIRNFQNSTVVGCQHPPLLFKSEGPDRGQPEEWPTIPVGRRKMSDGNIASQSKSKRSPSSSRWEDQKAR